MTPKNESPQWVAPSKTINLFFQLTNLNLKMYFCLKTRQCPVGMDSPGWCKRHISKDSLDDFSHQTGRFPSLASK